MIMCCVILNGCQSIKKCFTLARRSHHGLLIDSLVEEDVVDVLVELLGLHDDRMLSIRALPLVPDLDGAIFVSRRHQVLIHALDLVQSRVVALDCFEHNLGRLLKRTLFIMALQFLKKHHHIYTDIL